ncbi:MAG TPA: hypothetical protein VF219_23415 [Vicinamibacterales bacterium]
MKNSVAALALVLLGAPVIAVADGPNRAERVLADTPGLVTLFDDDGGRVEVFRHGAASRQVTFHGGAVVREPLVEVDFLGNWSAPVAAVRKAGLLERVGQISTSEGFQATAAYGIRTTGLLISSRDIAAAGTLNDLHIQAKIDAGMANGSLPNRDANVIHLIFLAPDLQSKLLDHTGLRDYHSYHSHFESQGVNVRYVVVPYDGDAARMFAAGRESLLRAIMNPDGDGWY